MWPVTPHVARLDHLVVTAPTLEGGVEYVADCLGVLPVPGGVHPRMGTHNALVRLGTSQYLEVIGARRLSREFGDTLEAANARQPLPFKFVLLLVFSVAAGALVAGLGWAGWFFNRRSVRIDSAAVAAHRAAFTAVAGTLYAGLGAVVLVHLLGREAEAVGEERHGQLGMVRAAMVALAVVLHRELPVARLDDVLLEGDLGVAHVVRLDIGAELRGHLVEIGRGLVGEADEQQARERADMHGLEAVARWVRDHLEVLRRQPFSYVHKP